MQTKGLYLTTGVGEAACRSTLGRQVHPARATRAPFSSRRPRSTSTKTNQAAGGAGSVTNTATGGGL